MRVMSYFMEKLEKVVSTQGYAVGNKVSLADLTLRIFIKDFFDDKGVCMHKLYKPTACRPAGA